MVVAVVRHCAIVCQKSKEVGGGAPVGHFRSSLAQNVSQILFLQHAAHGEGWREVHRVAFHDAVGLYGGKHGVYPASPSMSLVFYGSMAIECLDGEYRCLHRHIFIVASARNNCHDGNHGQNCVFYIIVRHVTYILFL